MNVTISNRQRLLRVNTRLLRRVALDALRELEATADELSLVLVDDTEMATLNEQFHAEPGPTDVLTFGYDEGDVTGEIIISVEHAVLHARRFHTSTSHELALYLVHGILHLHGHDDQAPAPRTKMRRAERRLIHALTAKHDLDALVKAI
jgi:probable rRNA maturation factor